MKIIIKFGHEKIYIGLKINQGSMNLKIVIENIFNHMFYKHLYVFGKRSYVLDLGINISNHL